MPTRGLESQKRKALDLKNQEQPTTPTSNSKQRKSRDNGNPDRRRGANSRHIIDTDSISTSDLASLIHGWCLENECRMHSARTIETKRLFLKNLLWFLENRKHDRCGVLELREFYSYLLHGHKEPGGRWGNSRCAKPVRPITVHDYHVCLRSFFEWLVSEDLISSNPLLKIPIPKAHTDHKPPLTLEQFAAILQAARRGSHPRRDEAILLFLLDTGVRSSELVNIKRKNLDLEGRRCIVLGKGSKYRTCYIGRHTARSLAQYLRRAPREPEDQVFLSERYKNTKEPLTRSGLQQMIHKMGKAAGIQENVSPHAFRRTFAVQILRNGANVFSLREMLGHTNLQMTQKYLLLAQADVEAQHRENSPCDALFGRSSS